MKIYKPKFRVLINALLTAIFGVAVVVLADFLGGAYLPVWMYILIGLGLFGLRWYAADYSWITPRGGR